MTTPEEFYSYYTQEGGAGWFARLGELRQAIIRCDGPAVLDILRSRCVIDPEDPGVAGSGRALNGPGTATSAADLPTGLPTGSPGSPPAPSRKTSAL